MIDENHDNVTTCVLIKLVTGDKFCQHTWTEGTAMKQVTFITMYLVDLNHNHVPQDLRLSKQRTPN